jgi:hypothetical protein
MVMTREKRVNLLVSDDEHAMLQALAEADGVTGSHLIRLFIRTTYAGRFGEKKPKTSKK